MAKSREKMLCRMKRLDPPEDNLKQLSIFRMKIPDHKCVTGRKLSVGYNRPLLAPVTFSMTMGENYCSPDLTGVGKSTLIKSI